MNIKLSLMKLFNSIFIITFGFLIMNVLFCPYSTVLSFNPISIIIGGGILILIYLFTYHKINKMTRKWLMIFSCVNFLILCGLQVFFLIFFRVVPSWDYGDIFNAAWNANYFSDGLGPYFYIRYPNNIPIYFFYYNILKLVKILNLNHPLIILIFINMIFVLFAVCCTYYLIYRRYGLKLATLFSFLMILVTPFYMYTTIVYTDTLTISVPIASIVLYFLYSDWNPKDNKRYIVLLLMGVLISIGILIRANVAIALIAIIIHYFMTHNSKNFIIFLICIITPFIIINTSYKVILSNYVSFDVEEIGFPFSHWIWMSLYDSEGAPGGYSEEHVQFTESLKLEGYSKEQIQNIHIKLIKQKLKNEGIKGYSRFINRKINLAWGDGLYGVIFRLRAQPVMDSLFYDYIAGSKSGYFALFNQVIYFTVLVLIWGSGIILVKKPLGEEQVGSILLFGVFLFHILWEASPRYLVIYTPIMLYLTVYSLKELYAGLCNVLKRDIEGESNLHD